MQCQDLRYSSYRRPKLTTLDGLGRSFYIRLIELEQFREKTAILEAKIK